MNRVLRVQEGWPYKWWRDFMTQAGYFESTQPIDFYLKPWGAKNIQGDFIGFETEQQKLLFILKWVS